MLNVKNDSLVAKFSKSRKSFLGISLTKLSRVLKTFFTQISIVSSNGMLVNKASASMKVSWQRTKTEVFCTHYFIGLQRTCCDFKTFHFEIDHLKTILIKDNYPPIFLDLCIKSFLNKLYTPEVVIQNVPKRSVFVKLPFLGSTSLQIQKKLQKLFIDKLTSYNLKIVFKSFFRVKSFLTFKDMLPKMLLSGLVYKYKCGGCNTTYYGKTNAILKPKLAKTEAFHISLEKR